jgi:phosphoribosylaminoimidazolecarboxamide formyltransferase/IMP cyclohydrolase
MIRTALLSVSDKSGIVELARALHGLGIKLISTGGTAKLLAKEGLPVTEVASLTKFPEMLDGRVKTLHPNVHGGLLARRDSQEHMAALKEYGIEPIDLLVINLYPFTHTVSQAACTFENAIENIDIGGPAMLRAAAKNYQDVTVLISPDDYKTVLDEMRNHQNTVSAATNLDLAKKVFAHTAQYDGAIANYLTSLNAQHEHTQRHPYPQKLHLAFERVQEMRYGENPHQTAAFYRDLNPPLGSLAHYKQLQGKELSYNNIADADAAWECVKSISDTQAACVIIKHANPCGVAVANSIHEAYAKALHTDPTSAFGGIIALNRECDEVCAQAIVKQFVEVLIAPSFTQSAKAVFANKQNVRLLEIPLPQANINPNQYDFKRVGGGLLVQSSDSKNVLLNELCVVTKRQPTATELADLMFAWRVAKFVKSNAIVYCANGMTLGIGAGQMSRVDSARIASIKAEHAGLNLKDSTVASDAFFPFRDGLDIVVAAGAKNVIQPGGSMRDQEVIDAADAHGIAMVFTNTRHFRH